MIFDLQEGQVYAHSKYFKIIKKLALDMIIYEFYNREQFYFSASKYRQKIVKKILPIEVTDKILNFIGEIKSRDLILLDIYFHKKPKLGILISS